MAQYNIKPKPMVLPGEDQMIMSLVQEAAPEIKASALKGIGGYWRHLKKVARRSRSEEERRELFSRIILLADGSDSDDEDLQATAKNCSGQVDMSRHPLDRRNVFGYTSDICQLSRKNPLRNH